MDSVPVLFVESVILFNWNPQNALELVNLSSTWGTQTTYLSERNVTLTISMRGEVRFGFKAATGRSLDANTIFQQRGRFFVSAIKRDSAPQHSLVLTDPEIERIKHFLRNSIAPLHTLAINNSRDARFAEILSAFIDTFSFVRKLHCVFSDSVTGRSRRDRLISQLLRSGHLERLIIRVVSSMQSNFVPEIFRWLRTDSFRELRWSFSAKKAHQGCAQFLIINWAKDDTNDRDIELSMKRCAIPEALSTVRKKCKNVIIKRMRAATERPDVYVLQTAGKTRRMFLTESANSFLTYQVLRDSKRYEGLKAVWKIKVMSWLRKLVCSMC